MRYLIRLLIALRLKAAPSKIAPSVVHRGECELSAGASHLGMVRPAPRQLSADEAERCFGRLTIIGRPRS